MKIFKLFNRLRKKLSYYKVLKRSLEKGNLQLVKELYDYREKWEAAVAHNGGEGIKADQIQLLLQENEINKFEIDMLKRTIERLRGELNG